MGSDSVREFLRVRLRESACAGHDRGGSGRHGRGARRSVYAALAAPSRSADPELPLRLFDERADQHYPGARCCAKKLAAALSIVCSNPPFLHRSLRELRGLAAGHPNSCASVNPGLDVLARTTTVPLTEVIELPLVRTAHSVGLRQARSLASGQAAQPPREPPVLDPQPP